jgi:hypothetical protein
MTFRSRTGVAAAVHALLLAASVAVPFGNGCGDGSATLQPDAASNDAAAEVGEDDATTLPTTVAPS